MLKIQLLFNFKIIYWTVRKIEIVVPEVKNELELIKLYLEGYLKYTLLLSVLVSELPGAVVNLGIFCFSKATINKRKLSTELFLTLR